jgi:nitroimidazol reductase NimA-like FMN-containing flavoprotein (pyridoxamine 5'-phosphate oxidase superfamily)
VTTYDVPDGFDLDVLLARPLIARIATNGPTLRPVWYLWEEGAFWWLTGSWSKLAHLIKQDPAVALLIDTWEPTTGEVLQLVARGQAEVHPFDPARARRKLARYLGSDESRWDRDRFLVGTFDNPTAAFVRLDPDRLTVKDLSYRPPS